jgi:hypothetical protein
MRRKNPHFVGSQPFWPRFCRGESLNELNDDDPLRPDRLNLAAQGVARSLLRRKRVAARLL